MSQSTPSRPQPPSISDPASNEFDGYAIRVNEEGDTGYSQDDANDDQPDWAKRALDAFQFSTSYTDSNYRKQWENSLKAFNNQHPGDSKYTSESFRKRSTIFRPKTRAVIRKNEAAAAAAFFSNVDRISVQAQNDGDEKQRRGADIMKELLQYRLTKSIPWFQTVVGALQDGQVQGSCAAHIYWRLTSRKGKDGKSETVDDMPVVDLIPIENLRIDGAASWIDPINTSPYVIHLIPMYIVDVKERMRSPDPKGRRWKDYPDAILGSFRADDDSTRQARLGLSQDPTQQRRSISDYDVVWVHRHIHRYAGQDWEFYTLASERMLTEPEPLTDTVFHGQRPYVMGAPILETHKPFPTSVPKLVEGLQEEANEIANQRLDNIKLVLNKRWFAKRGKNVDLASLVRNVPGGITLLDDPETDVKEVTWPDVTSSAYLEQDRIDADFSDLAGNFDPMQVQASKLGQASTNTMRLLQGPSNLLTEYMLKTFVETFVQPVLRQIVLLEQHYETDAVVLAIAGQKAKALQKFGIDTVTDDMLDHELSVSVNVGMGATDPVLKLSRFVAGMQALQQFSLKPVPGINLQEIAKEVFGLSGYQDGERFFITDPTQAQHAQIIQQQNLKLRELASKVKEKEESGPIKLEIAKMNNATKLAIADKQIDKEGKHLLVNHLMGQETAEKQHTLESQAAQEKEQKEAAEKAPAQNEAMETIKKMADNQERLIEAFNKVAEAMQAQVTREPKPKRRKGFATLPSGGRMEFDMSDTEH